MTVDIVYSLPRPRVASEWQLTLSKQIEDNHNFPIEEITRSLNGTTFIVSVETSLPNQAVENMLSDIEEHLPNGSEHVETREVD